MIYRIYISRQLIFKKKNLNYTPRAESKTLIQCRLLFYCRCNELAIDPFDKRILARSIDPIPYYIVENLTLDLQEQNILEK